jgi:rhodanese-related sulfurtransferase
MGLMDYFKSVPAWSVDEVKKFLEDKDPGEYNLVDVRLPREYEEGHLPGARLIPIAELPNRLDELDSSKPTIAY